MPLRNTTETYGWAALLLHWGIAVLVVGMFALGLYMTSLTYYDPWYRSAPQWHKDIGAALVLLVALRLAWRWSNPRPAPLAGHARWERGTAHVTHALLYLLPFALAISGYLISTADGRPLTLWGGLELPALITGEQQEDSAGRVHELLAWALIGLAALHALGALKHHFIDHDRTLLRMLGRQSRPKGEPQ